MGSLTSNYQLTAGVLVDEVISPEHHNRLTEVVDRVVGNVVKRLLTAGVHEGWELAATGEVSPGCGVVGGSWAETGAAQAIADLIPEAVNHVFVASDESTAPRGQVTFRASLSPTKVGGALYLGTVEVDESGAVVAVDSRAAGVDRHCWALHWGLAEGSGIGAAIPAAGTAVLVVEHEQCFRVPGALRVSSESEGFRWQVQQSHEAQRFTVEVSNDNDEEADFVYQWAREGILKDPAAE